MLETAARSSRATRKTEGVRLLSPEAAFITVEMLRRHQRPDDEGTLAVRGRWPIAWKTGTSWGFRDAWSAGLVGPYVLVVWIGNFDGKGNPAFVGVDAAAPLFFRIADALNLARPSDAMPLLTPPRGVSKVAVCAESGDLPNAHCPQTVETWYIPGKSPIRVSQLHRSVAIDPQTGRAGVPALRGGDALRGVRVLAVRHVDAVPASRHAAPRAAATSCVHLRGSVRSASHRLAPAQRELRAPRLRAA